MKLWIADSHVHFHKCFSEEKFFDNCINNILQASHNSEANGIIFLAQGNHEDSFNFLRQKKIIKCLINPKINYIVSETQDNSAIELRWIERGITILIIPGFQIVTKENLELLSLGTMIRHSDGSPIEETISNVFNTGGIPVLPWGFGKWYGKRGEIVNEIIEKNIQNLFLGDNGGRTNLLPYPPQFKNAIRKKIKILPGSDPLPFPQEMIRPLSYGFKFTAEINNSSPWTEIKKKLLDQSFKVDTYGGLTNPFKFLKTQLTLQLKKGKEK